MESVEISLERYHKLLDEGKKVRALQAEIEEMKRNIKELYTIRSSPNQMRGGENIYVEIDKLNLLGLLGIQLRQEGATQIFFQFADRGIFLNEGR